MSLRAYSLSALSLSLLLGACDGGGSSDILTDVPTAGSPDAPAVVTKGKVPGSGADSTLGEVAGATIVGSWRNIIPATDSAPRMVTTITLLANGTGTGSLAYGGGESAAITAQWKAKGSGYEVTFLIVDFNISSTGTAVLAGNTLTLTFDEETQVFTRQD